MTEITLDAFSAALKDNTARRERPSNPSLKEKLTLKTATAQQITGRVLGPALQYLFKCDVILYLIAGEREAKAVSTVIDKILTKLDEDLKTELERITAVKAAFMIDGAPDYDKTVTIEVTYKTPRGPMFLGILRKLDLIVQGLDMLFMNNQMDFPTKKDLCYKWRNRVRDDARKLHGLEQRAMTAAYRQGKGQEVIDAVGDAPSPTIEDAPDDEQGQSSRPKSGKAKGKPKAAQAATEQPSGDAEDSSVEAEPVAPEQPAEMTSA